MASNGNSGSSSIGASIINGDAGAAQEGPVTTRAFFLNLATGFGLFAFELTGFFLLKNASIGRRI